MGRLIIPFDRFELIRIWVIAMGLMYGLWRGRARLMSIWRDWWSRFLLVQISIYYLVVAIGRAQYGIGIMRGERYAYLGLALLLLLVARILAGVEIGKWRWLIIVLVVVQCLGLYQRAKSYVIRPQQLRELVQQVKSEGLGGAKNDDYLPHFVLNDERLKYSDLILLIND